MSVSIDINSKKPLGETPLLLEQQYKKSIKDQFKLKSRSIVKMPPINNISLQLEPNAMSKNSPFNSFKISPKRIGFLQAHDPRKPRVKNMSFSKQDEEDFSIGGVKSNRSININKVKFPDLSLETTPSSVDSKEQDSNEEPDTSSPQLSNVKKTLQFLTSSPLKRKPNDIQNTLLQPTDKIEPQAWPQDLFVAKKSTTHTVPTPKNEKRVYRGLAARRQQQPESFDSTPLEQITSLVAQENLREDSIPNIGATKHSLREGGIVKGYGANTHKGLVRDYNEDRVSIILNISKPSDSTYQGIWPSCSYFAVYDGHGGEACADFLRDNLHKMIIRNSSFPTNPTAALRRGFAEAEAQFLEEAQKNEFEVEPSGSCALVVLIVDDMCYVANVGDSRAVMSCEKGANVVELSRDHKPSDEQEQSRIIKHGGKVYQSQVSHQIKTGSGTNASIYNAVVLGPYRVMPGRLSVSRTFGDIKAKLPQYEGMPGVIIAEPEIKSYKITPECDFIVLGCDGIYDRLSSEEVSQCVWNSIYVNLPDIHQQSAAGVEYIMKLALMRRTTDNVTVVLIALDGLKAAIAESNSEKPTEKNPVQIKLSRSVDKTAEEIDRLPVAGGIYSTKNRIVNGRRAENIIRPKKSQDLSEGADVSSSPKKAFLVSPESVRSKLNPPANRNIDALRNTYLSSRLLKVNKSAFTSKI